jgi:hypothetical protein
MGCEFEFSYTAGLLLGRAELAGGGGNSRRGGGVVAAWWRRGVLERNLVNSGRNLKYGFKVVLSSY